MIVLAACWFVLLRACSAAGELLLTLAGADSGDEDRWFISFWVGLLGLASAVLALLPFAPAYYAAPLLLLAFYRHVPAPPRYLWPIAAAMTYVASSPVRLYDTALYHQPAIEWMSSQGLVPGLALVHFRFGFTSSWLALTSVFNVGPLHTRSSVVVTGLAIAVALAQWISLYRRDKSPETRYYIAGLPMLLLFFFLDSAIVSPSPNLGAGLAVFTGIWMLLRSPGHAASIFIAAGGAAIKISAAPLLIVAFFRAPRRPVVLAIAAAMVVPLFVANFQTTGCPVFPSAIACSDSSSALASTHVRAIARETLNWARYTGPYPHETEYFSLAWVPRNLALVRNLVVAIAVAVSLAVIVFRRQFNAAVAASALGTVYVYAAAPDPRFGAGFLLALPALALPGLPLPAVPRSALVGALAVVLTLGTMAGEWVSNSFVPDGRYQLTPMRLLLPAPAWMPPGGVLAFTHGGETFYRPRVTDRCGAAPLPCSPYALAHDLKRCGRGWCR